MNKKSGLHLFGIIPRTLLLICAVACVYAEDAPSVRDDKSTSSAASETGDDEKKADQSLLQKLADGLLKSSAEEDASRSKNSNDTADKMDRAVKGMRKAGDRLDDGATAEETQTIQKQVIKDLEEIINQLENPPPNQGGGAGGGGGSSGGSGGNQKSSSNKSRNGNGSRAKGQTEQRGGGRKSQSGQQRGFAGQEEKTGDQTSQKPSDSSKESQLARKAAEEAERRRKLEMDIWGHLPEHLREELLSTYGERVLPKYENLVKQFYESLSTQGESKRK